MPMETGQRANTLVVHPLYSLSVLNEDFLQVLLYLLRRCYGLIYRLLSSSEPVSEELMPIVRVFSTQSYAVSNCSVKANKLSTVKKCLNEVLKYGGPFSPRDLYPVRAWVVSGHSK